MQMASTADEWLELFQADDFPCEKLFSFEDVLNDEQAWACHALRKVRYPSGNYHTQVSLPMRLDSVGLPEFEGHTSRRIGADTREVLLDYGYTQDEIDRWAHDGVVIV